MRSNRRQIRLTENDLKQIIRESVHQQMVNEVN